MPTSFVSPTPVFATKLITSRMATASSSRNPVFSKPVLPSSSAPARTAPSSSGSPHKAGSSETRYVTRQDCPFDAQDVGRFIRSETSDWCPTDGDVAALIQMQDAQVITMTPDEDRSQLVGLAVAIHSASTNNDDTNDTYSIASVVVHGNHTKRGLYKRLVAELVQLCRGKKFASEINVLSTLAGFNSLLELGFDMPHEWNLMFATIRRSAITADYVNGVEEIKTYNASYKRMLELETRAFRTRSFRGEEELFQVPKRAVCYAIPGKEACLWVRDTHAANTSLIGPIIARDRADIVPLLEGAIQLAGRHPTHEFQVLALDTQWGLFENIGFEKVRIVPYMQHVCSEARRGNAKPHDSVYGIHGWTGVPKGETISAPGTIDGEPLPKYTLRRNDIMMGTPRLISRFIRKETDWIPTDEEVKTLIRTEGAHVFTMVAKRQLVAVAMIVPTAPGFQPVFLTNVIVAKKHRGLGVAKRMLAEIIIFCQSKHISEIRLVSSPPAFNLYLAMKFEMIEDWNMKLAVFKKVSENNNNTATTPISSSAASRKLPYGVRRVPADDNSNDESQLEMAQALSLESQACPGMVFTPLPTSTCYVLGGNSSSSNINLGMKGIDGCLWVHRLFDSSAAFIGPVVAKTPAAASQLVAGAIRLCTATEFRTLVFVHHEATFEKMGFKSERIVPYMRRTLSGGRSRPKPPGNMFYCFHNWAGP